MRFEGTVTTPKTPQQPTGPLWDQLRKAKTKVQVEHVKMKAQAHGYSDEGQLMRAITDRLRAHR